MAVPRSISSNCTSLAYAREPAGGATDFSSLSWTLLDPSAYPGEVGSTPEFITAETIGSGRAPQKGRPVGKSVGVQFESYMRQYELQPFLPGFFINFPVESPSTNKLRPAETDPGALTSVAADGYVGTNLDNDGFVANTDAYLLFARGFSRAANNGLKVAGPALTATKLPVAGLTAETSVPAAASIQTCGYVSGTTDAAMTIVDGELVIASESLKEGGALAQQPGTFIHIGGDSSASRYTSSVEAKGATRATNLGWTRIKSVTSTGVICDLSTFIPAADDGSGRSIQIYTPTRVFKDDVECDASRVATYAFERRLGKSDTNNPAEQCQLITGSFPNQLDFAIATKSDIKTTLQFMSRESYRRSGVNADRTGNNPQAPWSGTARAPNDKGDIYNTTFDIKRAQLYRHDSSTTQRKDLFGLITDGTFSLNNNATPIDGWGVYGAWDINPGYLMVDTTVTALFTTTEAIDLSEDGISAGLFVVFARANQGFILDVPLVTVKSSALTIENNTPITINVTNEGNESDFGYAASLQFFDYLPTIATQRKKNVA